MHRRHIALALILSTGLLTSCRREAVLEQPVDKASTRASDQPVEADPHAQPTAAAAVEVDPLLAARLLAIVAEYQGYGRVDDVARWAPADCRIPQPASVRVSKSRHNSTHGRKLYSLFARDRWSYVAIANLTPGPDQVIVKESWIPEPVDPATIPSQFYTEPVVPLPGTRPSPPVLGAADDQFHPFASDGTTTFRARERGPLFIMYNDADAPAEQSDQGWVYGTVTADGQTVTAAGRIRSCMGCHEKAPHGRLFGLAQQPDSPL